MALSYPFHLTFSEDIPVPALSKDQTLFGCAPFFIRTGPTGPSDVGSYSLAAPTTADNVVRLVRSLQLSKPILLEGPPGVGKSSLVNALAKAAGFTVGIAVNVKSEQRQIVLCYEIQSISNNA